MDRQFSPVAQSVCQVCGLVWAILTIGGCAYVVFGLNQSGWWFAFALFLGTCWSCKSLGSPEQIRANAERDRDDT